MPGPSAEKLLAGPFEQRLKVLDDESPVLLPDLRFELLLDLVEALAEHLMAASPLDLSVSLAEVLNAEDDLGSGIRCGSDPHHGRNSQLGQRLERHEHGSCLDRGRCHREWIRRD